jgi:hypothetical protein
VESARNWPPLPLDEWEPTYQTLHRFTQIVGKLHIALSPPVNHWWHATLRFNARGLTTTPMPIGGRDLEVAFDFVDHVLRFSTTDGIVRTLPLGPMSVADFYAAFCGELRALGVSAKIWPVPVEVSDTAPFPSDRAHRSYDREQVERMWHILANVHRVFEAFRGRFIGKSSPVHFFWGAFDVAVSRFSGRPNPSPPEPRVMREAYSHEVISHGFWFGGDWPTGGRFDAPLFYAYSVPEPAGFRDARIVPSAARYDLRLGEFVLPYDDVRVSANPERDILAFMQSTYDAGASLAGWDRASLDRAA